MQDVGSAVPAVQVRNFEEHQQRPGRSPGIA
jgi:hypothetical protein